MSDPTTDLELTIYIIQTDPFRTSNISQQRLASVCLSVPVPACPSVCLSVNRPSVAMEGPLRNALYHPVSSVCVCLCIVTQRKKKKRQEKRKETACVCVFVRCVVWTEERLLRYCLFICLSSQSTLYSSMYQPLVHLYKPSTHLQSHLFINLPTHPASQPLSQPVGQQLTRTSSKPHVIYTDENF